MVCYFQGLLDKVVGGFAAEFFQRVGVDIRLSLAIRPGPPFDLPADQPYTLVDAGHPQFVIAACPAMGRVVAM